MTEIDVELLIVLCRRYATQSPLLIPAEREEMIVALPVALDRIAALEAERDVLRDDGERLRQAARAADKAFHDPINGPNSEAMRRRMDALSEGLRDD